MQHSTDRIRTTHWSEPRPPGGLLDLMKAAAQGQRWIPAELAETERQAVTDVVARQRAAGLDVICDGEQTKTGFFAYIGQRLSGFEPRPGRSRWRRSGPRSIVSPNTTSSTSPGP